MKGQKARAGVRIHPAFEGGQSELTSKIPKIGFNQKKFAQDYV